MTSGEDRKMDVMVNVVNQKLRIATNLKTFTEGSQEFIRFVFNLPSDWDSLTVFAQFVQDGTAYSVYLDSDNAVCLPPEIVAGDVDMLLYGTGGDIIATTNSVKLKIAENPIIHDASSTEITQTLYQQLVNMVQEIPTPRLDENGIIMFE